MPTLKIATNTALSITPTNAGTARRLLCDPRRLNLNENKTPRLRDAYTPPKTQVPLKKLNQIGSLGTRRAAPGDVLFTHNLRRYIHDVGFFKDQSFFRRPSENIQRFHRTHKKSKT